MSTISSQNALSSVEAAHTDATENARYSAPSSSRAKFDAAQLQPQLTSTLNLRLRHATWDKSDKERNRALSRSIAELVKAKMLGAFALSTPTASCSCFTDHELALRQRSSQKVARPISTWRQRGTSSSLSSLCAAGFKYIVQVQLVENLGQGGRGELERCKPAMSARSLTDALTARFVGRPADLACHWEDSDSVVQEMYSNKIELDTGMH
ncbi:uncharacterized protein PAN0_108c6740 [Moesziomyces antarcticus]|uniref:Uncharacterized protein n=1 Tax=Pseudozyma antarctica TaxID=84753 RepID=A0A081CP85_PSEA2|nr:uncharacterized protein PAN0_108c6740 [Moesziomyces antarcticus]GAK68481.1 hypothetical protein PAN0_108c6740 [Moesziomyces antarcticus]